MVDTAAKVENIEGPEWIDKEFIGKILRKSQKDGTIKIEKIETKLSGKEGEHFGSVMYRVAVLYTKLDCLIERQSLIVKVLPEGAQKAMLDSIGGLFETEIEMYSKVIPVFESMLNDKTVIGGECLYSSLKPRKVLIFEDLSELKYEAVSSWGGNWTLAKGATEKLAKWHAVSYKLHSEGKGDDLHKFSEHLYAGEMFTMIPLYRDGFGNFLEMLKNNQEFGEYVSKFERIMAEKPLVKTQKLMKSFFNGLPAKICVLNHGDFHIKNVMFKDNDLKLVDFQLCIFGPAVIDLIYMLYMFLDDKDRLERRDEIIKFYFDIFTKTLKHLGFTRNFPKMVDLQEDFLNFKEYELMVAVTMLPLITELQANKSIEPSRLNTDEFRKSLYKNSQYVEYMKKALPEFLKKGLLD